MNKMMQLMMQLASDGSNAGTNAIAFHLILIIATS